MENNKQEDYSMHYNSNTGSSTFTDFLKEEGKVQDSTRVKMLEAKKANYEAALKTLTPAEKDFALLHELSYSTVEKIAIVKAKHKDAYKFTFWSRFKAGLSLIFKGQVNNELELHVMHNVTSDYLANSVSSGPSLEHLSISNAIPVSSRPLRYATFDSTETLAFKLQEAGIELTQEQRLIVREHIAPETEKDRIRQEFDDSLYNITPPTVVETIKGKETLKRKTNNIKKPAVKAVRKPQSRPKKTK